jgi:hypothetical protein
LGVGVAEAEDE